MRLDFNGSVPENFLYISCNILTNNVFGNSYSNIIFIFYFLNFFTKLTNIKLFFFTSCRIIFFCYFEKVQTPQKLLSSQFLRAKCFMCLAVLIPRRSYFLVIYNRNPNSVLLLWRFFYESISGISETVKLKLNFPTHVPCRYSLGRKVE